MKPSWIVCNMYSIDFCYICILFGTNIHQTTYTIYTYIHYMDESVLLVYKLSLYLYILNSPWGSNPYIL